MQYALSKFKILKSCKPSNMVFSLKWLMSKIIFSLFFICRRNLDRRYLVTTQELCRTHPLGHNIKTSTTVNNL